MPDSDGTIADHSGDLALIRDAAREAGEIALRYFRKDPEVWMKGGSSPVSEADMAVDGFLKKVLLDARPDYGWLSEESVDDPARLSAPRTFVVDPIDGTRAFIDGRRTWCVSVAVVEDGVPLAGVLDCPALGEIFLANAGGGSQLNGTALKVRALAHDALRIGGPKAYLDRAPAELRRGPAVPYVPSLAYRIAMIAAGEMDGTFVKPNSHDWDLAAADLILREAGGAVLDEKAQTIDYARADPRRGVLVAAGAELAPRLAALISAHQP